LSQVQWRASLLPEDVAGLGLPPPEVVGFTYVLELEAIAIGLSNGELLLLHTEKHEVEELGLVQVCMWHSTKHLLLSQHWGAAICCKPPR
jgi:hypothetical protein